MRFPVLLLAMLLACSAAGARQERSMTLAEALSLGRSQSRQLKTSEARLDAAAGRADETAAALLPSLKFEGSYKRLSDVDPFAISLPVSPQPIVIAPNVLDNYTAKVTLQQPLFTGFRLQGTAAAAEKQRDAARLDRQNVAADVELSVTSAYWTLYQLSESKHVYNENVDRLERSRLDTENLLRAGLVTRNDLLKIEVQLAGARLSLIDITNETEVAMMNLATLLGLPVDTRIAIASVPAAAADFDSARLAGVVPQLIATAFAARPDISAAATRVEASKASVQAAQGNWWPQLFLNGSYYYNRPNARYQPARDEFKSTWDVGVTMQFDLWNWGTTKDQVQQATAAVRQQETAFEQLRDNVAIDVRRAALDVRRAADKIEVARSAVQQADEQVRTTNDKYRNGLASSSDLLDADVALLQTRLQYTSGLVEYEIASARLARAIGGTPVPGGVYHE